MNNSLSANQESEKIQGISNRREFIKSAVGASALIGSGLLANKVLSGFAFAQNASGATSPDLILLNGKIATVDAANSITQAVAISGNKIMATGSSREIQQLAGSSTKVIDVGGKTVIPGLNDSHIHFVREGMHYHMEVRWDGVDSVEEALELLRQQAQRTPKDQWIRVIGGYSWEQFKEKRMPTLEEINAVAPDHPVFVMYLYAYALINKAAIKYLGLDEPGAPIYPGGIITRDGAGRATGLLVAAPSGLILYKSITGGPRLSDSDRINSSLHYQREMHRFGVTSVSDAGGGGMVFPDAYSTIQQLHEMGKLKTRTSMYTFAQVKGKELADYQRWTSLFKSGEGDAMLKLVGGGENICWAAYDFEIFAMPRPEIDPDAEVVERPILRQLAYAGWPTRQHMTYNQTINRLLPIYEEIRKEVYGDPAKAPLMIIDHAETITEKNIEHIMKMNGIIGIQNRIIYQARDFAERYGMEVLAQSPPVRKMLNMGMKVAAGTDATRVSSYNPWLSLAWLATGKSLGDLQMYGDDNLLDRSEVLRLWTINGAASTSEESLKGSIEPGKFADLVVLDRDFFSVSDNQLRKIESLMTIVDGEITYARGPFKEYDGEPLPEISPSWSPVAKFGGYR
ncbi:MAG: amidohydrolase [Desulfocapsaceae bacterium]|nr:amidohydrolase [Desulfocapsaceae bacterium]